MPYTQRPSSLLRRFASLFDGTRLGLPLLLVVAVAAFRLFAIEGFPAFIHNDESAVPLYIVPEFLKKNPASPLWGFNGYGGHGNLGPWLSSVPAILTGNNSLLNARIAAAVSGTLSAAFFALALGITYGRRVGLLALLALIPFHFHLHFSRAGFTYIHAALAFGVLSWAFALFHQKPTLRNAILLGAITGLSIMTYSASQVYPAAVALGVLATLWSTSYVEVNRARTVATISKTLAAMAAGFLLATGPQLLLLLIHGIPSSSRLQSQLIFKIIPAELLQGGVVDWSGISKFVWNHFIKTVTFFTARDGAVQYGSPSGVCETFSGVLAVIGMILTLWRACRLDSFSIFLTTSAVLTVIGSTLMLEASFSPHFIVFTLLIPGAIALGFDGVLRLLRLRQPILTSILAIACAIPWAVWNVRYIQDIDARKFGLNVWLLRLPIPPNQHFTMANATQLYADFQWPMFSLAFPNAKFVTIPVEKTRSGQIAANLDSAQAKDYLAEQKIQEAFQLASGQQSALLIIEDAQQEKFERLLVDNQMNFTKYSHPKIFAKLFYVQK